MAILSHSNKSVKKTTLNTCQKLAKGKRRKAKAKTPNQRRYWLDVGKAISLELTAAKYDQADASGEDAQ